MKSNTVPACLTEIKQFRIKYIDGTRGYYAKETSRQRKTIIVRSHWYMEFKKQEEDPRGREEKIKPDETREGDKP